MLHIVQVVLSGSAEIPKLFIDEAKAESAYVECAKEYWAQSYSAYCERHGVSWDCFSSAKAFIKTFDLAEKSTINYWIITPEDTGLGNLNLMGAESITKRREDILRLAKETEQTSRAVKEGLTGLLGKMADLADHVTSLDVLLAAERYVAGPEGDTGLPSPILPQEEPEEVDERYSTPEWKSYVQSIKNMCGGGWSEFHLFNRHDWRQDVYSNATSFEYWEWAAAKIDTCITKAENAGYSVVEDSDYPGAYRFKTPDGVVSEISFNTEEEAWCHASLHFDGLESLP
ncbi:MAG TPA: hypothetical protein VIU41_14610 [Geobacteraceae bacterium]